MASDINSLLTAMAELLADTATETAKLVDHSVVFQENKYVGATRTRAEALRSKTAALRELLSKVQPSSSVTSQSAGK